MDKYAAGDSGHGLARASVIINNTNIVASTHIGLVKLVNEDRHFLGSLDDGSLVLAVADGLGGDVSSDVAAEIAMDRIARLKSLNPGREAKELDAFARELDLIIDKKARTHPSLTYMATTLVCLVLRFDTIHWLNAGDSRFYILRDNRLIQVTQDQTLARVLVEEGKLKPGDAEGHFSSDILDQCLGYGTCDPETGSLRVKKNDLLILATDGMYKMVGLDEILTLLTGDTTLEEKIEALMSAALAAGGTDNITIVLARV